MTKTYDLSEVKVFFMGIECTPAKATPFTTVGISINPQSDAFQKLAGTPVSESYPVDIKAAPGMVLDLVNRKHIKTLKGMGKIKSLKAQGTLELYVECDLLEYY